MIHRLALRVLPRLALAVTESEVRKRKRRIMLVPGLVAFVLYRAGKFLYPFSDIISVLAFTGLASGVTAVWAYRAGRRVDVSTSWREDGVRRIAWILLWVGVVYGIQLSLMVLALLKVVVQYDFLLHPDGPALMALMVACASVARDAFEIGHIRRMQHDGEPVITFPDGAALRAFLADRREGLFPWVLSGAVACLAASGLAAAAGPLGREELSQLLVVTVVAGVVSVGAYLSGTDRPGGWPAWIGQMGWWELFRFWWWPGLAFAATYYLVLAGLVLFVFHAPATPFGTQLVMAATVGGVMALYCHYLGVRRRIEDRIFQAVPASLTRCPFIMGILSGKSPTSGDAVPPPDVAVVNAPRER